jgi:GNAT superfamily N-acetyltransferase
MAFSKFGIGDYNMPASPRESIVSVRPFQIRSAIPQDLDQLCDVASQLLTNIRAEGTPDDARRVFEHIMQSPDRGLIVVAESNDTLCGYAYASYVWRAEFCGETMDIVALFVTPQWRSKGVGGSLISSLLENAKRRGIRRISAEVHPGNSAIEHTLESSGFDPERRTLWGLRL